MLGAVALAIGGIPFRARGLLPDPSIGQHCVVSTASLLSALREAVGDAHVLTDPDLRAGYERDWTGRWLGRAAAVVRPASTEQVVAVLRGLP